MFDKGKILNKKKSRDRKGKRKMLKFWDRTNGGDHVIKQKKRRIKLHCKIYTH